MTEVESTGTESNSDENPLRDCTFCDPQDLTQSAVYKKCEDFKIIADPFPTGFGHFLIVPERHVETVSELRAYEFAKLQELLDECKNPDNGRLVGTYNRMLKSDPPVKSEQHIRRALKNLKKPDGYNIGINEGKAAGQTIEHLHIHVLPRFEDDAEHPEGGVRNVVPRK